MSELKRLKESHARLSEQVKEARKVILLWRRWEHASDASLLTGDEADTAGMLIEASFAAQAFIDKWEAVIRTKATGDE
jgi:hypothetical protein